MNLMVIALGIAIVVIVILTICINSKQKKLTKKNLENEKLIRIIKKLRLRDVEEAKRVLEECQQKIAESRNVHELILRDIDSISRRKDELENELSRLQVIYEERNSSQDKSLENQKKRLRELRELYDAVKHSIDSYADAPLGFKDLSSDQLKDLNSNAPTVILSLNCLNYRELNALYKKKMKQVSDLMDMYRNRYTTKVNASIYQLLVIGLSSELQNILTKLKYGKLEDGKRDVKAVIDKYLSIASEGNQTIASTLKKFIYELEKLYYDVIDIEYEYYIKREQARQEQIELRERMREEREEQRRLKEQEEALKREEEKFKQERARLESLIKNALLSESERIAAQSDFEKLEEKIENLNERKEDIVKLQLGKAGYVYVISNVGSFGDHVFKVGMTRRLDPQERVDELGSASVPFPFDVHSFIFSEDAPSLETALHKKLDNRRVNKVNQKKEFFDVTIDELEKLVYETYPSAEFNRTMLAEQYRQSLSLDKNDFYVEDCFDSREEE